MEEDWLRCTSRSPDKLCPIRFAMSAESQVNTFPARNHDQPFYFIRNKTSLTARTQRGQFVRVS